MNMSAYVLGEFTDDTRWLRFFSTKSFVIILIGLAITWILCKVFALFGIGIVGLIIGGIITVTMTALTMIPVIDFGNMIGAGQTLDMLLIKKWIRKKEVCVYV